MNSAAPSPLAPSGAMPVHQPQGVSALRRNLLRLPYAIMTVGIAIVFWPDVFHHTPEFAVRNGATTSLLAGLGAMAAFGILYPLRMLPVLLFELLWKAIYLTAFALPLWLANRFDPVTASNTYSCLPVVLFIPFVPWRYVVARGLKGGWSGA